MWGSVLLVALEGDFHLLISACTQGKLDVLNALILITYLMAGDQIIF